MHPTVGGLEVRGGKLAERLVYNETELAPIVHLIGFLSQKDGSNLRIFDAGGTLVQERVFAAGVSPGEHSMSSMLSGKGGLDHTRVDLTRRSS